MVFLRKSSSSAAGSPSSDSMLNGSIGELSLEVMADSISGGAELGNERGGAKEPCRMVFSLSDAEE